MNNDLSKVEIERGVLTRLLDFYEKNSILRNSDDFDGFWYHLWNGLPWNGVTGFRNKLGGEDADKRQWDFDTLYEAISFLDAVIEQREAALKEAALETK